MIGVNGAAFRGGEGSITSGGKPCSSFRMQFGSSRFPAFQIKCAGFFGILHLKHRPGYLIYFPLC